MEQEIDEFLTSRFVDIKHLSSIILTELRKAQGDSLWQKSSS